MTPRRVLLGLMTLFFLLSVDRLHPDRATPPAQSVVATWEEVSPTLPGRNEGRFGWAGDPLNMVFLATPETLRAALLEAGWTEIPLTIRESIAAGAKELFAGKRLAAFPPMNDYRLKGRRQSMNWSIPIHWIESRHHFRLWDTGTFDPRGRRYWWGSGNFDVSARLWDMSHRPDPDANLERDFVVSTLLRSPRVETIALVPHPRVPLEGANDKGYPFRTDGRVAVIVLR
jgi:hypothetical protein